VRSIGQITLSWEEYSFNLMDSLQLNAGEYFLYWVKECSRVLRPTGSLNTSDIIELIQSFI